jgi:hypothetical protein
LSTGYGFKVIGVDDRPRILGVAHGIFGSERLPGYCAGFKR